MNPTKTITIQHFLLVFDHAQGRLIHQEEFQDRGADAVAAYSQMERTYQGQDNIDIVLVGSDSIETVKFTHANYFDRTVAATRSKYLSGLDGLSDTPVRS